MKVRILLTDNTPYKKIVEVAAYIQLRDHLISQYYVVFTNDDYQICWLNDPDMEVVDNSLRPEWQGFEDKDGFSQESGRLFPEFTGRFWEDLLNKETDAMNLFEEKRRLFAGPNLKASHWLGFEYPMKKKPIENLDSLFRYDYPTSETAIRKREELSSLLREIMQAPFSIKNMPSIAERYALNLAIQLDEVGVAMYLLSHTRLYACVDDAAEYHGRVYPPPLVQAVSNSSTDAFKLLLGYGACTDIEELHHCFITDELKPLMKMPIEGDLSALVQ